ncbi:MAG TPA: isoaspartyl peptidase/L-asparaginase [Chitinophagaceae bacterium]|nr:isoaspartyl peptidase/L-asparaginase [Chitinophagaceae bacterium]
MSKITLAIHGGSGTILKEQMSPELETAYLQGLNDALNTGYALLEKGKTAVEVVKVVVMELENNVLFNAGRGAVFTNSGTHEMDAAIMSGKDLRAGAVAAVNNIRNPVELAWMVMNKSEHVFLSGKAAEEFAREENIPFEPDDYFFSQFRHDQWQAIKDSDNTALDHNIIPEIKKGKPPFDKSTEGLDQKFGTVGAVAIDINGNLAAATSTGGMTNKKYGRIGDSPIIGIGTYANNKTCAISCTGHGEPFIRSVAAYDVSCLMEYKGMSLKDAMKLVVMDKLIKMDGEGGMIGVDANGEPALIFNSTGMYRGMKSNNGKNEVKIYK